jgi:tRNA 5-methylaminomethyl-2-thiouridine biosynthesis bifunctional protein
MAASFPHWALPSPALRIDDRGTPHAEAHDDVYFQTGEGRAESRHVFLDGVDFPAAWADRDRITLRELGFGTGLNLLLTWEAWRTLPTPRPRLHYQAIEGYPLGADEMAPLLAAAGAPVALVQRLLDRLPPPQPGFHSVPLEDGFSLILAQGPVETMMGAFGDSQADIWFLDGFAPDRNPDMWSPTILARIGALSAPGARLATFTAVGAVRRALADAGFSVERRSGYGRKWHCVAAVRNSVATVRNGPPPAPSLDGGDPRGRALWSGRPLAKGQRVALVGGGVAGCAAARALARAGLDPVILEAGDALAREASGNPVGLFMPRLTVEPSADGRFHAAAWIHALRVLEDLEAEGAAPWVGPAGLLCLPANGRDRARQGKVLSALPWPEDWLRAPEADDWTRAIGDAPFREETALWMGRARCIRPAAVCAALAGDTPRRLGFEVMALDRDGPGPWRLRARDGRVEEADAVVLCAGAQVGSLLPDGAPPPLITRGQISLFDAPEAPAGDGPGVPLAHGGYVTPWLTGPDGRPLLVLGASHEPMATAEDPGWRETDPASHAHCLDMLSARLPDLATHLAARPWRARVSRRARTGDRRPLVGPLPGPMARALEVLGGLRHGPRHRLDEARIPEAFAPNLWILGGLGSRGFQTAPLAAELLAALMTGTAPPVEEDVRQILHPARFLVRALARGEIRA